MKFKANTLEDLEEIAEAFLELFAHHQIFAFKGEMGVGKTTFISYLAKKMGIEEQVSSPTFGYVNEYESPRFGIVYHFDLYRINDEEEALDIGIEDYIYGNHIVFIEWAENIANLLPENCVWVNMTKVNNEGRTIEVII